MEERILQEENAVSRHGIVEIIEHWLFALSGLILIFSGFGELPMFKRYMITELPLMGWSGDFFIHLKIHYLAAVVFVSVVVFHLVYHGLLGHRALLPQRGDGRASLRTILSFFGIGEEPPADKYLPEQRLAYVYIGMVALVLIVTGLIKVVKNLPGVYLPPSVITVVTLTHTFATLFFVFGVVAHLAALIIKANRPLVRGIFTGRVDLDYVRRRHTLWYDQIAARDGKAFGGAEQEETPPITAARGGEAAETGEELPPDTLAVKETSSEKES